MLSIIPTKEEMIKQLVLGRPKGYLRRETTADDEFKFSAYKKEGASKLLLRLPLLFSVFGIKHFVVAFIPSAFLFKR